MRRPYPFAAVLFDLDGVVIETTELHYRVWDEFGRANGHAPTPSELLATNGRQAADVVRRWLGAKLSEPEVTALTAAREAHYNKLLASEPVPPVPGVKEFVEALAKAGIPRAVATSAVPANADLALSRVGLHSAFDAVITAADVLHGKPAPECYVKAAAAVGVSADKCVVIEDSVLGIRAAKAAGARCVALATSLPRDMLTAERPGWLLGDFTELPDELRP